LITVLTYLLTFIEVLVSLLLLGIILIQRTKSQGMGLAFGSGMGESLFGAQVGNVLTKTTVVLAIIFLVNTTLLAMIGAGHRAGGSVTDTVKSVAPAMPAPVPASTPVAPPVVDVPPAMAPTQPAGELPQVDVPVAVPPQAEAASPSAPQDAVPVPAAPSQPQVGTAPVPAPAAPQP
jgi:preprotein translocase subunit SecG